MYYISLYAMLDERCQVKTRWKLGHGTINALGLENNL